MKIRKQLTNVVSLILALGVSSLLADDLQPANPPSDAESKPLDPIDGNKDPAQLYPKFKTPTVDATLPEKRFTELKGFFYILINKTAVPVVYSLPMDGKKLADSASNLIFYGPYPGEKTQLDKNIVPQIVTNLGCSVFSFSFSTEIADEVDSKDAYWFKEAGWLDAALAARDALIKGYGLQQKKLILMGYSAGGGMVMNFAGAFPNEIEAVAAQAPNAVPPFPQGNTIKWLMVVNRGDRNIAVMKPFYEQLRVAKCNALFCETTPERGRGNYHSPSAQTFDLIYSFIAGILEQRKLAENGVDDVNHVWPYAAPSDPLKRYAVIKTSNLTEQDVEGGLYDLLPSAAFAANWLKVCPPSQKVLPDGEQTKLVLNFPALPVPKGIVLYYDAPGFEDVPREIEDVSSLAEHGCLVISPTSRTKPDAFAHAAIAWEQSQNSLRGIRIHLVGYGLPGAQFISNMAGNNSVNLKSMSLVDFNNSTIDDESVANITSLAKGCGMYGFFSYFNSQPTTNLTNLEDALVTKGSQERGCFKVAVVAQAPADDNQAEEKEKGKAEDQAITMVKALIDKCSTH